MIERKREVTAIVSVAQLEENGYDDNFITLDQKTFSLDELLNEEWFLEELKSKGFYSSNLIHDGHGSYLDRYIYKIKRWRYNEYYESLDDLKPTDELIGIYQEVINRGKIEGVDKFNKARIKYIKRMEKIEKEKESKKEIAAEKRRLKQIEKAKKILKENECKS